MGSRVKIIVAIVVKNITNRCQASGFRPIGVGKNHNIKAKVNRKKVKNSFECDNLI